jgi:proteasome assembly chaperone (PAC2) family protein
MLKALIFLNISSPLFGQKVIIKDDSSINITSNLEVFNKQYENLDFYMPNGN